MLFLCLTVLLMGMLVPIQTAANARLRGCVGSVWVATLLSFCVSTLALLVLSLAGGVPVLPTEAQLQAAPWWSWGGGIVALLTITAAIYLFRTLGMLQATILPILGQLGFSLVIDHFGLFRSVQIPLTLTRLLAMLVLVAGVALVVVVPHLKEWRSREPADAFCTAARQLLGVGAGCLMASIGAIYGTLGTALGSPVQASTLSFIIASAVMLLCCACGGVLGSVRGAFSLRHPLWMWLGGIVGAVAVYGNAWLIPLMGAGYFFMLLLFGQMLLSLGMEWRGWLGSPRRKISPLQGLGLLLMLIGIAVIK